MKKVFAIFIFILLLSVCLRKTPPDVEDYQAIYNESSLYKLPGDFDGDKITEYIYIVRDESGNSSINLIDNDRKYTKNLNINIEVSASHIRDINKDKVDDLIIYTISNGNENLYVFSFDGNVIKEIFSPELLSKVISFKPVESGYILVCGKESKEIPSKEKLYLSVYYTDYEYKDGGLYFISEGSITTSRNETIYSVSIIYNINTAGSVEVKSIELISDWRIVC